VLAEIKRSAEGGKSSAGVARPAAGFKLLPCHPGYRVLSLFHGVGSQFKRTWPTIL